MKTTRYFAHSAHELPESQWQLLREHLEEVGRLAAAKAAHFNGGSMAQCAGLLHDLGKYCDEFQARLRGAPSRVDHATWGAIVANEKYGHIGKLLAYSIAGHHAGLADGREGDENLISPLAARLSRVLETRLDPVWKNEIQLASNIAPPNMTPKQGQGYFQLAFLGRMIFSCLVDADFLDTEAFYNRVENQALRDDRFPNLEQLRDQLNNYLAQPRFRKEGGVNSIRAHILREVRKGAERSPGLFSLNVPTGGGKTLTSLAFALDHAIRHGQRRVILVIPFTSIVEQNAAVFREALGALGEQAVLEHHSAFTDEQRDYRDPDSRDKLRQAAENWEAPIVVTTAVQFFESLFANRSSRCRKLHNIANSVVILDEAQTLPLKLLKPCLAAINELALNYRSSLVLCTATQPALLEESGFRDGLVNVRELAPDPNELHKKLERVSIRHIGSLDDEQLAEQVLSLPQVLCIVNNRRHARSLYEQVRTAEGSFHLTTLMCASHRSDTLDVIRERLRRGLPCRVVSTSLIEAGVDVDFPQVYRAEAGLDSIAQAAGRCNREGRFAKDESFVSVFTVGSDWNTPPELEQYAEACRVVFRKHNDKPLSLAAIQDYFQEVYWIKGRELDAYSLLSAIEHGGIDGIPYERLARQFSMIESNMRPIIVPYMGLDQEGGRVEISSLLNDLRFTDYPGRVAKCLQRYLVQVPEYGFKALAAVDAIQPVNEARFGNQFMELVKPDLYDRECGLNWDDPAFVAAEQTVM